MAYGENLSVLLMDNQQPSPEQGKAQRPSAEMPLGDKRSRSGERLSQF